MTRQDMSKNTTPTSPSPANGSGENPFFDQLRPSPDLSAANSTSAASSRPGSASGERTTPPATAAVRSSHRVRFGSGEALDDLNNRYTFSLRSHDDAPKNPVAAAAAAHQHQQGVPQTPPITLTSPNNSPSGRIYPQTEYFTSPIDVDSIGNASVKEKPFPLKAPPRTYSFGNDDELEMNEKYDQFHAKGQLTAKERAARLSRIGSFSAPGSAQTSPILSPSNPLNTYSVGAGQVQGGVPVDDIPLLDLGAAIPDSTTVDGKADRPKIRATKEAHDLVRQHTQRGPAGVLRPMMPRRSTESGFEPRSGAVTPVALQHEDYVKPPEQFRGGILSSLLKLYNPAQASSNTSHYAPSIASTAGSPTASGRTTPKWYNKSANTSSTSLGLLAASGAIASPAAGSSAGKNVRPKPKHRPHSGGVVGAIKNFSRANANLENEIKVRYNVYFFFFLGCPA